MIPVKNRKLCGANVCREWISQKEGVWSFHTSKHKNKKAIPVGWLNREPQLLVYAAFFLKSAGRLVMAMCFSSGRKRIP